MGAGHAGSLYREAGGWAVALSVFDTDVRLYVFGEPRERAALLLHAAEERCRFFERTLSRTRADSDIARAHVVAPHPVCVAPETAELVACALDYGARSRGRFDVTMGTVTRLWDFHHGVVPERAALERALGHVGAGCVRVGRADGDGRGLAGAAAPAAVPTLAILDPETVLDLGGIAKGYVADDLCARFAAAGGRRFLVNLGGNVAARGGKGGGEPWRVGVADPRDPERSCAVIALADGSVVTSGAHERCFTADGMTYHHILDPRTGMPAVTDAASVTIVAERSLDCDGYSTTAFMLGMEEGAAFIEGIPGVEGLFVGRDGRIAWTSGLAGRVQV